MDKLQIDAINLHTLACFLVKRIEDEHLKLKDILHQLETGTHEPLLYCSVKQLFLDTQSEIWETERAIEAMLRNPDLDIALTEELTCIYKELFTLNASSSELEEQFIPYLFCPALNPPEHQN